MKFLFPLICASTTGFNFQLIRNIRLPPAPMLSPASFLATEQDSLFLNAREILYYLVVENIKQFTGLSLYQEEMRTSHFSDLVEAGVIHHYNIIVRSLNDILEEKGRCKNLIFRMHKYINGIIKLGWQDSCGVLFLGGVKIKKIPTHVLRFYKRPILHLENTGITSKELEVLYEFKGIREINLMNNKIEKLPELDKFPDIQVLMLGYNPIIISREDVIRTNGQIKCIGLHGIKRNSEWVNELKKKIYMSNIILKEDDSEWISILASNKYSTVLTSDGYSTVLTSDGYNSVLTSDGYNSVLTSDGYNSVLTSNGYSKVLTSNGYSKVPANDKYSKVPAIDKYSKVPANDKYSKVPVRNNRKYSSTPARNNRRWKSVPTGNNRKYKPLHKQKSVLIKKKIIQLVLLWIREWVAEELEEWKIKQMSVTKRIGRQMHKAIMHWIFRKSEFIEELVTGKELVNLLEENKLNDVNKEELKILKELMNKAHLKDEEKQKILKKSILIYHAI